MKRSLYLIASSVILLASCGGSSTKTNTTKTTEELTKLKKQRSDLDEKINKLEAQTGGPEKKATAVSVIEVQPAPFNAYIEVQAQITGDQNVTATSQAPGVVKSVNVHVGQHVGKGQVLATLDAAAVEQQIKAQDAQLSFARTVYTKQQKLWAQNIGTEIQLLQAKANYEAASKQRAALVAQRAMYTVKSPISGIVDQVNLKPGDATQPGAPNAIRVVSFDQLKAQANLGENYLGKVKEGDPTKLVFPDLGDTIRTKLTYVARAVDPISRAFMVEIRLGNNKMLHPNMSCKMQIANYQNSNAIIVPVSVIQKTAEGDMLYIADGGKAKAVVVTTGRNSNGMVEILSGLNAGDKVITEGFEELDNGEPISIQ